MCAMRAVIQFEVYCLQEGRWTLNSRFGQTERQDAIKDAMHAEGSTGLPTKVIRDTYFPDTNTNETVTIYSSPKLKAQSKNGISIPPLVKNVRRPLAGGNQIQRLVPTRQTRAPAASVGEWIVDFVTRSIVAALLSLLATFVVTGIVTWLFMRLAELGFAIQSQTQTAVISFVSIGVFALGFMAFFRVGSRFRNFIRRLWAATSPAKSEEETTQEMVRALRYSQRDIKPKNPSRAAAELERQTQEVKRQRGDPDAATPAAAETTGAPMETFKAPTSPAAPPAPVVVSEKMHQQSQQPQQPVQAPPTPPQQAQPPPAVPQAPPQQPPEPAAASAAPPPIKPMDLLSARDRAAASQLAAQTPAMDVERALLSRFVAERVMPLLRDQQDDPITRRGLALLMAGAVSHLVVVAQLDFGAQDALLSHGLSQCRLPPAAVEAFLLRRAETGQGDAGWMLQDAGRAAMAAYLDGSADQTQLQAAWRTWRLPLKAVRNENPAPPDRPRAVYLTTELKGATNPMAMDFHNRLVRAAIEEAGGSEVKHTGRGIMSHFDDGNAAIATAVSIADSAPIELGEAGGWYAVSLVPAFNEADDPLLSPRIGEQAQSFLNTVRKGEIACDRTILASSTRGLPPGYFAHDENIHYITIRGGAADSAPVAAKGRA